MASVAATEITLLHDDGEPYSSTPELPDEILDAIEQEAHDFVWNMHRVGDEPEMGEYYRVLNYLFHKKYAEYFSQ